MPTPRQHSFSAGRRFPLELEVCHLVEEGLLPTSSQEQVVGCGRRFAPNPTASSPAHTSISFAGLVHRTPASQQALWHRPAAPCGSQATGSWPAPATATRRPHSTAENTQPRNAGPGDRDGSSNDGSARRGALVS